MDILPRLSRANGKSLQEVIHTNTLRLWHDKGPWHAVGYGLLSMTIEIGVRLPLLLSIVFWLLATNGS